MRHVTKKSFSSAKVQVPAGLCKKNGGRFVSADLQAQNHPFFAKIGCAFRQTHTTLLRGTPPLDTQAI